MQKHAGEYALIKNQKIIGFFSSAKDVQQASSLIKDNIFSIQKVEVTPKNLGYFSYAMA